MIYVTGDLHGLVTWPDRPAMSLERFSPRLCPAMQALTEEDFLLVAGDFGYRTAQSEERRQAFLGWFARQPFTTLFVDGNHENFPALNALPVERRWGGRVHPAGKHLYHLLRGEVYRLPCGGQAITLFAFGGAHSVDKAYQQSQGTWWPDELPTPADYDNARKNLAAAGSRVDLILTHTGPYEITRMFYRDVYYRYLLRSALQGDPIPDDCLGEIPLNRFLHEICQSVAFRHWYIGHIHEDLDDLSAPGEAGVISLVFTGIRDACTGALLPMLYG